MAQNITPGIQRGPQPLDTPFSPIFRRATKDGATGGRQLPSAAGKNAKQNDYATGGRQLPSAAGKNAKQNDYAPGERRISRAPSKNEKENSL